MTCIVGLLADNALHMGCDSFVGSYYTHGLLPADENKLFKLPLRVIGGPAESMLFGYAGTIRVCQVVKHNLELPLFDPDESESNTTFLINKVIPAIKRVHASHGVMHVQDGVETAESSFLVGWRNRLYYVGGDYSVVPAPTPYLALGSGEDVAMGSLQSTTNPGWAPIERLRRALKAASDTTNFVREPFYFDSITL